MASLYRSIFKRDKPEELTLPSAAQPVMRVLEPRVLLDAAAVETALDIAGQAAHSQLADDYLANVRSANPLAPEQLKGESGIETEAKNKQVDDDDETSPENAETENLDREIIFIDAGVDDKDSLIASLEPGVSVHILDAKQDGVQQIADILSNGESYSAVHIFSHGQSGQLQLGNTTLDINSMRGEHRLALRSIGNAIDADGDLLLYGCDFGDGAIGQQAARELSFVTGADIAASDDLTGAASLAGDWDLEVQVGSIQAQAYSLPEWQGILANFEIEATAPPVVSHQTSGIIGTVGTQATWVGAVTHTPGGGPTETYDIRATIIGASGEASATFETTTANPTSPDDIRVVVTNVGAVTHQEAGQDVLEEGSVTVIWEIFETGTTLLASSQSLNLVMQDLDGLAGLPQTIEGISLDASEVATYTTEAGSNLTVFGNEDGINVQGTVDGTNDPNSKIGFDWVNVNQFILTYQTYTQTNAFDMDGDGDVTFAAPVVTVTQSLDLDSDDSSGATNDNYQTVYFNGLPAGPINDVPVAVADLDISIFDISDIEMESATITLTNSSAGDQLNIDTALLSSLGITGTVTGTPPGSIVVDLDGYALTSNYETAIKSITYENTNPDGTFDRTFARIITVDISDGLISTTGAQTVISFGTPGGNPVAGSNIYVQDEDSIITATAGTGLLSDDMDPEGDPITVLSAMASNGDPIAIGSATTLPSGASITLNADGSFTYAPVAHYSGVENITYTITDGALTSTSWASFDIQPVVDAVSLTVLPLNPTSDEDIQSSPVVVTVMSPDVSETQIVIASNIPIGVVLTDGTNEFTSSTDTQTIEITDWNLNQLRILPVQNSDLDVGFLVTAVNSEVDGSQTFQTLPVTFVVDAVADEPLLIVQAAGGPVDGDVDLSLTIQPTLFDTDGSEQLTAVQISQIPVGAQMLVSGVPQTIVGGSVTINPADIANLVFRPPVTGLEIIYNMEVRVTATEVSPENGVTLASATRGPVTLTIDLNNNDDPVFANDDVATTFTGETVTIDALQNDYVPDGGEFITLVEGQPVGGTLQVVLAGGEGVVELDALDRIVFTATAGFTGEAVFQYTVQDVDGSTDTADITVTVLPRWIATAQAVAVEGGATQFQIGLEGNVAQNSVISTEIRLADIDTTSADYGDFVTAVNDSITNLNQDDFSFDGTVLTYTTPVLNYDAVYDPTGSTFTDISGVGTPLGLGDDGISPMLLGFDFDFYGDTFSNAYVSANGYLTFGSPVDDPNNDPLDGSAFGGRPAIAAFWDDLNATGGEVFVYENGALPGTREVTIQWQQVSNNAAGSGSATFQMVLSEATNQVRINYQDVTFDGTGDQGSTATIGLQSRDVLVDQYSFNQANSVVSGSSLVFNRGTASNPTLIVDVPITDDPTFEAAEDFAVQLSNPVGAAIGTTQAVTTIDISDNTAPNAIDDAISTTETTTGTVNVLTDAPGIDTDVEGHTLQVTLVEGTTVPPGGNTTITIASGAMVTLHSDGTAVYDPNGAFNALLIGQQGFDSFTYTVDDGFGGATVATVNVTIDGENQIATFDLDDDGTTANRDNTVMVNPFDPAIAVTAADAVFSDPDDASVVTFDITLGNFQQPSQEVITISGTPITFGTPAATTLNIGGNLVDLTYDGANAIAFTDNGGGEILAADIQTIIRSITYQNISGADLGGIRTLTFDANDGDDVSNSAVGSVNVVGFNIAPVANDDGTPTPFSGIEDTSIIVPALTLLANDSDPDLDPLSIISVQGAVNGSVVLNGGGDPVFTPDLDYFGSASFTYTVSDGRGGTDTATVFLTFTSVNDAPRIDLNGAAAGNDHALTYTENDPAVPIIDLTGTLTDDSTTLTGAQAILTNGQIGDIITVGTVPPGLSIVIIPASAATGLTSASSVSINISGSGTPAEYEAAIKAIRFEAGGENPDTTARVFNVVATDGSQTSVASVTTITVVAVNDDPIANADGPFTTNEDTLLTITPASLLANDSDPEGDTPTLLSVQGAVNGFVSINGGGDIEFVPNANFSGAASFTYTIDDGNGGTATATVTITVDPINDAPTLDLDTGSAGTSFVTNYTENSAGTQIAHTSILLSDIDNVNMDTITVTLTNGQIGDALDVGTLPAGMSVVVSPSVPLTSAGTITVTLSGPATLNDFETALLAVTYRSTSDAPDPSNRILNIEANDGADTSPVAVTTVSITQLPDAPTPQADGVLAATEDTPLVIPVATLLANDTDPDGDILTVVSVQSPVNGTVVLLGGNVTFTPDPEYSGPASFIYVVDDGTGNTAAASVNISVSAVNDAPTVDLDTGSVGVDYSTSYTEDGPAASIVDPSLAIADVDNTSLTGMIVTLTTGRVGDQLLVGALPPGITSMSVPPVPLATDGSMTVTLVGPALIGDFETALQAISFHTVSDQPDVTDRTITIVANDGSDMSTVATTTVSVTAVNDAPVGTSDGPLPVNEDSSLIVTAASLLANDTDGENDALSITSVQSPVNGTVSLAAGTITFTPTADYFGPASFTYTVDDGNGGSDTVTVNVSVTSVNDITILDLDTAVAGNDHSTGYTEGGAPVAVVAASVSITDIDDTNIESATIVLTNGLVGDRLEVGTLPAGISAVISPPGSLTSAGVQTVILSGSSSLANYQTALQLVTYQTTSPNPSGVDRDLQINVNDGDNNSATANTVIAMTVVNDAPIAGDDGPYATNENTPIVLTHAALLANDSDGEGDPISITSVQGEVNGSVAIVGSTVVFTPTTNYFGPASFTYTVDDGNGGSTVATVNINVILINDAPDLDLDGSAAGNDYAVTYTENSAGVAIADTDASIADPEHANMTGGMVTLTNGFAGDVLEAGTLPAGITATIVPTGPLTGSGPITVTLTGSATQADYATALAAITYRSTSENPSTTTRTVTSVVTDGVDPSLQRTTLVTVVAVDDAPIAGDDGTPLPLAAVEDTPFIFNPVASNDIDYEGAPLTITQINATPIVPGGSVVLIEGLIALDLDGQTLTLTPNANFFGPVSFVYTVSDGALTDTANVNIDFAAVNDAPVALDDGPVVLVEDGSSTFDPVAANDSDVEGDPLTITQIDGQAIAPTGTLALANGSITLAADGTTLQFVPTANYTGQFSISYTVTDGTATDTASLTYDVQSTEDPVTVVSTPSDQTYNDSDNVILPLAAHFFDPDGQTITYSAANLPLGLSIDSSTGVVSGTIDSSASQSGPYTVTVSASDGVTVPASTAFQILVNNIAPVSAPPATVPTGEGDTLSYDVRPLFSDADGDTLTYSAVGLPVWATFNPATGLIGGVVPTNAALAGPVNVTITANDGDGGSTNTTVTIDPFNPSPIRVTSAPDVNLDEGDTFDFDVAGHFVDGGNDTDTLTYSVTGLPSGITFDATLNTISGNIEAGTRRATPYVVALTADDGQGGVTVTTFQIRVGDFSFFADDDPFISLEEFSDAGKDTGSAAPDTAPSITDLVDQLGSLSSTETLEDDSAIILKAVEGIDPLYEATLSGTDDGLPEQVDKMDELSASTNWLSASGRAGNGNWQVDGADPETPLSEQWEQRSELNTDGRLDKILLETYQKHGSFFIELVNNLDPMRDGQIVRVSMTLADGQPLPEWMKEVRQGIITANPPEGVGEIVLTVLTELGNQNVLTKEFTIDFKNTDAEEPASKEEDKEKETVEKEGEKPDSGSFNDPKSRAALRLEALRGSVETETVQY